MTEFHDVGFSMPCQVVIYPVGNEGLTKKLEEGVNDLISYKIQKDYPRNNWRMGWMGG